MERTAKPTAGNFQCSERRKQSAGHAARRNPQEAQAPATGQKTARLGTGRSNYGAVVGAAVPFAPATPNATERAVKVLTTVVALTVRMVFFARGRENKTIHLSI